ncbi:putative sugar nucleotidyl transferase [Pedobacter frigoris]|uniref:putative sugar nucleotidyl transferase n=1 Tax=Pedobacter frigoris TaxID=2571272 RepID=UPI002930C35B|nr:putative sugar nucleotidyl transferase [Pedobacter frigoris]
MMINLFDDSAWQSLRPLSFTRPVADLRVGILTIAEKWKKYLNAEAGFLTIAYLAEKYPANNGAEWFINGSICPDRSLVDAICSLKIGESLKKGNLLIAYRTNTGELLTPDSIVQFDAKNYSESFIRIEFPEDIFKFNHIELTKDFELITHGRISANLGATNTFLGENFFAEEGAIAECSTFNSLAGPVYLGKNTEVWEGCHIRGSFALCHNSQVKMGARIYGQTTVGPYSKVAGEMNNVNIWGYSSKGHEGYLGNAVLGQWCNIGADSNNSNLKNNYSDVKVWEYAVRDFRNTKLQFCGLIMADHAKCGINTMFNTGTVVGVSANVFGPGFPPNFIPDFSWGGPHGFESYKLEKMFQTAARVYERRNSEFNQIEKDILIKVFNDTEAYRHF